MKPGPGTEEPIMPRLPLMLPKLEPIRPCRTVSAKKQRSHVSAAEHSVKCLAQYAIALPKLH